MIVRVLLMLKRMALMKANMKKDGLLIIIENLMTLFLIIFKRTTGKYFVLVSNYLHKIQFCFIIVIYYVILKFLLCNCLSYY